MPIKQKSLSGQPILFRTGHSGDAIQKRHCCRCKNYINHHCNILEFFKKTCKQEKIYPKEWIYNQQGWPSCSQFNRIIPNMEGVS